MPCTFQQRWLTDIRFKDWVCPIKDKPLLAKCRVCKQVLDISTMGASALNSHSKAKSHKKSLSAVLGSCSIEVFSDTSTNTAIAGSQQESVASNSISNPVPSTSRDLPASTVTSNVEHSNSQVSRYLFSKKTAEAEIWWTLRTIDKNHSFSSNTNIDFVMKKMFGENPVSSKFTCGETKTMYLTVFGIKPYLDGLLRDKIGNQDFVIMFDESLNDNLQKKQCDFHIRIWEYNNVKSRYLTSNFLGKGQSENLYRCFTDLEVDWCRHMISVSMDGPNVNWAVYKQIDKEIGDKYGRKLLDVGSCA